MVEVSDTALEPIGAVQRTPVGREATEPMRADIRLLGTILGDTVREQNGDEVFDLVERARVESFRVRHSQIDRAQMSQMFEGIDIHRAIPVIRAFSHFALLANVAEDIHRERRRAIHVGAGEPPQDSTLAATYAKLDRAQLDSATVADALQGALVSPVITAHPTETRRRTVFVTQHRITELMRLHAEGHTETDEGRNIELELRRQVLTLWQTALLRLSRLQITDEIEVGLRYYPAAFFTVIPQVNAEVRDALRARWPDADLLCGPILQPGSWIGGDRDGNPNVTADVVRQATGSAAFTALSHYLAELTALDQELTMSARLLSVTRELAALAEGCQEIARADEPYRRALRVIRGRLTATAAAILDRQPQHQLDLGLPPYATPAELQTDLDTIDESLRTHGSALLADDRLALLREGVRVFGFHLSGLDMRQNSDVHEEVVAELLSWAGVHEDYGSLPEEERVALLAEELSTRRPLVGDHAQLSDLARSELDVVGAAAHAVERYGPAAVPI
ncbi:phosphoenolpyruvate carboxylase, partial [Mycobacterium sp.]|uniref:phosphoenolpyruvate carboxylase n=1 Tax=Mycobacterium sp. TaxID=1785 RepID=UPI003F96B997